MHRPRGAQRSAFVIVILVLAFVLIPSGQSWSGEDTGLPRLPLRHLPAAGAPFETPLRGANYGRAPGHVHGPRT